MKRPLVVLALAALAAALAGTLGARAAEAPESELRSGGAVELELGKKGAASLTIAPRAGRSIDADAPFSLRVSVAPTGGVKLARARYALADAADPRAEAPRFDLALEALAAGDYTVTVDARFWICAAKTCRPVRDKLAIPVKVVAPPPPPVEQEGPPR